MEPAVTPQLLPRIDQNLYLAALKSCSQNPSASFDILGYTREGDPLCRLRMTDFSVADEEKFHLVFAGLHVGGEHAALHGMLSLIEFLLTAEAAKYLKKVVLTFLPVLNPYGCFRKDQDQYHLTGAGTDPYTANHGDCFDWDRLLLRDPGNNPELAAFCKVMDEEKPEVLFDMHGCNRRYSGQNMRGTIGCALSNQILCPWSNRFLDGLRSGVASGHTAVYDLEENLQRISVSHAMQQQFPHRFRPSWEYAYTDLYPYLKYHTMPIVWEVGCEETVIDAVRGMLEFCMKLPTEWHGSLPVDHVLADFGNLTVNSYGVFPGQRRRSRVELWSKLESLRTGYASPVYNGFHFVTMTVGKAGVAQLVEGTPFDFSKGIPLSVLAEGRQDTEVVQWSVIRRFLQQVGDSDQMLYPMRHDNAEQMPAQAKLENGVTLRSHLPYSAHCKLTMKSIHLNGFSLACDPVDGYELLQAPDGWHLFVNIPPEKSKQSSLYILAAEYDSNVKLQDHWSPSPEIIALAQDANSTGSTVV